MRYFKRLLAVGVFLSMALNGAAFAAVQNVDTKQMQAVIEKNADNPDFIILDVSPAAAFASSHLEGALSLPANDPSFEVNLQKLDKSKTYLVYCHRMNWTPKAVEVMSKNNFTDLYASSEGKAGWMQAGGRVVAAGPYQVDTQQVMKLVAENKNNPQFVILDVSPEPAFARAHIEGAVSMAANSPNFESKVQELDREKTYLVYCMGGRWTPEAINIMQKYKFSHVIAASEGLSGWMRAGSKVVSGQ
ncbi:rhodanese-like domain-containing protein [Desulfovibrio sp.]|uniref:rhodanese-like domain-containing protein n=1 Tax=Desulfovibrio sp. TaxID=885 RepID=UPI0025C5ADAB|nr:rhodanese-like domain-containing protein [Desulfovibrio sp.]